MILAENKAAPLRFLLGVGVAWVVLRGVMLTGWSPPVARQMVWAPGPGWLAQMLVQPSGTRAAATAWAPVRPTTGRERPRAGSRGPTWAAPAGPLRAGVALDRDIEMRLLSLAGYDRPDPTFYARATTASAAAAVTGAAATPPLLAAPGARWSGSAWAFVRGGGFARPLSPDGQIGAGQAGVRVLYRATGAVSASARISRTIGGPDQTEAAAGIDWQPAAHIPVHLTAERRIAIDRGGRDAFAIGAAGGAYAVRLAPGWRLDGYGEAGMVGFRRRDLYADGAVRAGRALDLGDGRSLTLGLGAWGAAQPQAARLDAGPSAVLRLPVSGRTIGIALDWRGRLVGSARPHSGVALTIGVDF